MTQYVHGYDENATKRLNDQATTLSELLHKDTKYADGTHVLEIGCGVGGQTEFLVSRSPLTNFMCVDIDDTSLEKARRKMRLNTNVSFKKNSATELCFEDNSFDHAFICFVLEHLDRPEKALAEIKRVVRPEGTVTVIEGDHGSVLMHPECAASMEAIDCQIKLQQALGGNPMIGRKLYPLLKQSGFQNVSVAPRQVYVDASNPELVDGFTKATFTNMISAVRDDAVSAGIIKAQRFDEGILGLEATTQENGTFSYTFFKALCNV